MRDFTQVDDAEMGIETLFSVPTQDYVERDEDEEEDDLDDVLDDVHRVDDVGPLQPVADLVPLPLSGDRLGVGFVVKNVLGHVRVLPEEGLLDDGTVEALDLPGDSWKLGEHLLNEDDDDCLQQEDEGEVLQELCECSFGADLVVICIRDQHVGRTGGIRSQVLILAFIVLYT